MVTPFVQSWLPAARSGVSLYDPEYKMRRSAWAHWGVTQLVQLLGVNQRQYTALQLPGKFYSKSGFEPSSAPHIELSKSLMGTVNANFADRLALAGNTLLSPWWIVPEALAVRKVLLASCESDISEIIQILDRDRVKIVRAATSLIQTVKPLWYQIQTLITVNPGTATGIITSPITSEEVAEYIPAFASFNTQITFDQKLKDSAGSLACRRIGVWRLQGVDPKSAKEFSIGVITPRLTINSQFNDPDYLPEAESTLALVVRSIVIRRLAVLHLGLSKSELATVSLPEPVVIKHQEKAGTAPHLRASVAQPGFKLPQASILAVTNFLQHYKSSDKAWEAIVAWAQETSSTPTVSQDQFRVSYLAATLSISRAEQPERDDVDTILPICWDAKSRVIRLTYSKNNDGS